MSKEQVADSVRDEFSKLTLDGKTAFLVEAIFSTAGTAINEIGSRLSNLVDLVTDPFEADEEATKAGDEAAESTESADAEGAAAADAEGGKSTRGKGSRSRKK